MVLGHTNAARKGQLYLVKLNDQFDMVWSRFLGIQGVVGSSSIMQTSDGGFAICGNTADSSAKPKGIVFFKTDSLGNVELKQSLGGSAIYDAKCVRQTSDGGYIISAHLTNSPFNAGTAWLIRLNASGDLQWTKTFDGIADVASVRQMFDGGYLLACDRFLSLSQTELCLIRTDAEGNLVWAKQYTDIGSRNVANMIVVNDGVMLVGKSLVMKTDLEGHVIWAKNYDTHHYYPSFTNIWKTTDNGFILMGGNGAIGLVKIDEHGEIQWSNTIAWTLFSPELYTGTSIMQTPDGGYILTGYYTDFYNRAGLIKTDASGHTACKNSQSAYVVDGIEPNIITPSFTIGAHDTLRSISVVPDTGGYFSTRCSRSLGIEDEDVLSHDIRIYPNPVSTILTIENNRGRELHIVLSDVSGREVSRTNSSMSTIKIPIETLAPGMYLYIISDGSEINQVGKIVKE